MDEQGLNNKYNVNLLRGWQRSQLRLLKEFTIHDLVPQAKLSLVSGSRVGSHELGGKLTALTRADLIQKAGKDDNGQWIWQLNDEKVDKTEIQKLLESIGI
ncbi:hypothetical protein HY029_05900 [Candidatus Gottesmanbacteria bacterium]|nr:hypothetical protein [Candidatus Gottesmanbacteria bacterium]